MTEFRFEYDDGHGMNFLVPNDGLPSPAEELWGQIELGANDTLVFDAYETDGRHNRVKLTTHGLRLVMARVAP